jgi:hypothetical protein
MFGSSIASIDVENGGRTQPHGCDAMRVPLSPAQKSFETGVILNCMASQCCHYSSGHPIVQRAAMLLFGWASFEIIRIY